MLCNSHFDTICQFKLQKCYDSRVVLKHGLTGQDGRVFFSPSLSQNEIPREKKCQTIFSHFTCLAGGGGCVDAGLALSKAKKDDNDNDFDYSEEGTCPDAIGQNSVS